MIALREPQAKLRARLARAWTPPPRPRPATHFTRIGTFWQGDALPPFRALCVRSWLALGYAVDVFSYTPVAGLPEGARRRDAAEILPAEAFSDAYAPPPMMADIFRLALIARGDHVWCDADLMLLRRLPPARNVLIGREPNGHVCNAVLWMRRDLGPIDAILGDFFARRISPWSQARVYSKAVGRRLAGRQLALDAYPMHHWGRHALAHAVVQHRLEGEVLAPDAFYHADGYSDRLTRKATGHGHLRGRPEVIGVHFFWKDEARIAAAEPGSFVAWARARFGQHA